ncbi:MAG: uroporphyrinogen-III synthase [Deltaproteobacteria bacterium]|jgi:uroporphyrinogen III methyltransferase/synthase|nr:uroporphyrinogen-III synthase [Deltaproteobacteria bacterium]
MSPKVGKVYLIGVGPGSQDLLTVKGLACLQQASVVIYDDGVNPDLLDKAPFGADVIGIGSSQISDDCPQQDILSLLKAHALSGKTVVCLTYGDPLTSVCAGLETSSLVQAAISFEVVPGVTPGFAAATYAGIPLSRTDRLSPLGLMTGPLNSAADLDQIDLNHLMKGVASLVLYPGFVKLDKIAHRLIAGGCDAETPAAVIFNATLPEQNVFTGALKAIADAPPEQFSKTPTVLIVGEIVNLRPEQSWYGRGPLSGRKILITRAATEADRFAHALADLGAVPIVCPTIAIVPPPDIAELDAAVAELDRFDYLILTSANAVNAFFERLKLSGRDSRTLCNLCVVAVGPKTAERLDMFGIKADLVPADYRAEGVVTLLKGLVTGKRVLYPKAARARDLIPRALTASGAEVVQPLAYASEAPPGTAEGLIQALESGLDLLTFSASSTVSNFVELIGANRLKDVCKLPVASIGPLTTKTCQKLGLNVVIEPQDSTLEGLIDAIVEYYS